MRRFASLLALALFASSASAQLVSPLYPPTVDTSNLATKSDVQAASTVASSAASAASAAQAAAAAACQPMAAVPGMEVVGGTAGSGSNCRLVNAVQPRITRTASCALASDNTCTTTWDGGPFPAGTTIRLAGAPGVISSSATMPITCHVTSISITGISFKCFTAQTVTLNLSIVTAGLNLNPFLGVSTATVVQVTAIPTSGS